MKYNVPKYIKKEYEWYLALLCLSAAVLFWGFAYISTKILLTEIPPISLAFYRQIIATCTLIPFAAYSKTQSRITLNDFRILLLSSLIGLVFCFILKNIGLQQTTASNASMIISLAPIFTMLSQILMFQLKATRNIMFCLLLSMIGVYLLVAINGRLDFSSTLFFGNLLTIGAMICWVIYTILNQGITKRHSCIKIVTYQSILAIFLYVPFIIPETERWRPLSDLKIFSIINLFFLGMFCSAFAYVFYNYAIKILGATISSAFLNLIPVVTVVSGYVLLQEKITAGQISGMILILCALYILNRISPPAPIHFQD